jgi:hypothetical protein
VRSRISQGHREDFYELTDQRFLGAEEFVDDIRRDLKEKPSFVLEKRIREDEAFAATIAMLRGSPSQKIEPQYSFS